MTCDRYFVGLDVGGSTMKAGVVTDDGRLVSSPLNVPTEPAMGQDYALQTMAGAIRQSIAAAGQSFIDDIF